MKSCPVCRNTYPSEYQACPLDQAALITITNQIVEGTVLRGKYEVLTQVGAGGMASVYKVRHKAFHELAAVKVVHQHFMHDPDFIKRFRNEAVVARHLKHPHAVRIDDFDISEDGRPFIVMEYVEGQSLYEARKQSAGAWPVEKCSSIVKQAASALGAAHALGIVHRDIKPSNILLQTGHGAEIHVKVLDFGIAKVSQNPFAGMTSVNTHENLIIGTPEYMSPEQAGARMENAIDGRADLYSLGLIFYEMLTGAHPFKSDTPMGMLIQQLHTAPAPPYTLSPPIPAAISALVLKCLEKDPNNRFQNADELLAAMEDPEAWYRGQAKPVSAEALAVPAPVMLISHRSNLFRISAADEGEGTPPRVKPKRSGLLIAAMAAAVILLPVSGFLLMRRPAPHVNSTPGAIVPAVPAASIAQTPERVPDQTQKAPASPPEAELKKPKREGATGNPPSSSPSRLPQAGRAVGAKQEPSVSKVQAPAAGVKTTSPAVPSPADLTVSQVAFSWKVHDGGDPKVIRQFSAGIPPANGDFVVLVGHGYMEPALVFSSNGKTYRIAVGASGEGTPLVLIAKAQSGAAATSYTYRTRDRISLVKRIFRWSGSARQP